MSFLKPGSTVLVTGSTGQVGQELKHLIAKAPELYPFNFVFSTRDELDLSNQASIKVFFETHHVDAIINCAAYTAVDQAEVEADLAYQINAKAIESLGVIAKQNNSILIHLSTDYVFDGESKTPYQEDDLCAPQSVYGSSKRAGEEALLAINPSCSVILRSSWVFSPFGQNFVKTMLRLGQEKDEISVVCDQFGSPSYAADLAKVILEILVKINHEGLKIYHSCNDAKCSWYDFAKEIMSLAKLSCLVKAIKTTEYPTAAKRPPFSVLDNTLIKTDYSISIRHWRDALKACIERLI